MSKVINVSPSLINSFNYIFNCYEGQEGKALGSFLQILLRVKCQEEFDNLDLPGHIKKQVEDYEVSLTSEAMQKGVEFESVVNAIERKELYNENYKYNDLAVEVANYCRGGQSQVLLRKSLVINGHFVKIKGYADHVKQGEIIDIKTTRKYNYGKYFDNVQTDFYLAMLPEAEKMTYLVTDFKDIYFEKYYRDGKECERVRNVLKEFINFLTRNGLIDLALEKKR